MDSDLKKDATSNKAYIKRYKDVMRLVRISKMLSKAKIIIHNKS
jgi:hypothetical protein